MSELAESVATWKSHVRRFSEGLGPSELESLEAQIAVVNEIELDSLRDSISAKSSEAPAQTLEPAPVVQPER